MVIPSLWVGAVALGVALAALAIGVYLTFRVINFPDLTIDGSFPLGAAVCAVLVVKGLDPWLTLPVAIIAGSLAGVVTGLLATRLKINGLMAGILVMIGLYSVNLRVMDRSNIPLLNTPSILTPFGSLVSDANFLAIIVFGIMALVVMVSVHRFLNTEIGLALQATGDNEQMARASGIDTDAMKVMGLAVSNGLIALSGALIAQYQGYADIGMGLGMIVAGIASVIIGEALIGPKSVGYAIAGVLIGSIIYRLIIALALLVGLAPTDMKLATAVIVIIALATPQIRQRVIGSRRAAWSR